MKEYKMTKSEFKEEMKKRRLDLFDKANKQLKNIIDDEEAFLHYLKLQATLGYTVSNTLMIMHDNPNVTCLKDYAHWKELGAFPKKNEKGISILEPSGKEYIRKDGSRGVNYNIKYLFDVAQTNYQGAPLKEEYPKLEDVLEALSYKCDINPILVQEVLDLPRSVFFSQKDNCIYVYQYLSIEEKILGLMREYAYIESLQPESYIQGNGFSVYCIVYMLASKYNIPYSGDPFISEMHSFFSNKTERVIKKNLEDLRKVFMDLTNRIDYGIYAKYYHRGNDYYER